MKQKSRYWSANQIMKNLPSVQCAGLLSRLSNSMTWHYKGEVYDPSYEDEPKEYQGFVYVITEIDTGMKYVGKKFFHKPKTLPITLKRKRRVRSIVESDWRSYYGSNAIIQQRIDEGLSAQYYREILHFGKSKGDLSYLEVKEQMDRDVLIRDDYYNGIINCKIHRKHLKTCLTK